MKPILTLTNQKISGYIKTMGKDNNHLKFYIKQDSTGRNIECLGFKLGQFADDFRTKSFDLAFTLEENHWKGNVTHYLNIKDVKFRD
jgi:single-stranded-DNA-specific exonuclease